MELPISERIKIAMMRYPKARLQAVTNVAYSAGRLLETGKLSRYQVTQNLYMDARLYKWNTQTINAIKSILDL